jgi:adenylylsulfate reductase, subunit B
MPPVIDHAKCTRCQLCAEICPMSLFSLPKPEKAIPEILFPEECWHCNACVLDCPGDAIRLRMPINYNLLHIDAKQLNAK